MEQLIPVIEKNDEVLVEGRSLHEFLQVETRYTDWFKRMKEYGFVENVDFTVILKNERDEKVFGGIRKITEHHMKLDMAKEVAMIQRTEKGKQARQYFIAIEKEYKQKQLDISQLSPELQMFHRTFEMVAKQELKQKQLETKLDSMADLLSLDTAGWRKWATSMVRKIANKRGGQDQYREVASESYQLLEYKGRCNLEIRLTNRQKNMIAQGMGKSAVKRLNKLDIIAEDHRLKEIYISVVRQMAFKEGVWNR